MCAHARRFRAKTTCTWAYRIACWAIRTETAAAPEKKSAAAPSALNLLPAPGPGWHHHSYFDHDVHNNHAHGEIASSPKNSHVPAPSAISRDKSPEPTLGLAAKIARDDIRATVFTRLDTFAPPRDSGTKPLGPDDPRHAAPFARIHGRPRRRGHRDRDGPVAGRYWPAHGHGAGG